jgi:hypothetical protein
MKYSFLSIIGEWNLVQTSMPCPSIVDGAIAVIHPLDSNIMILFGGETSLLHTNTATNQMWFYFFGISSSFCSSNFSTKRFEEPDDNFSSYYDDHFYH